MSYKYLFFALLPFLAISCQEDETLDLVDYPNTAISLFLPNSEDPLNGSYQVTYAADGTLNVDKEVAFKVQLATASPNDVTVDLAYTFKNISGEEINLPQQVTIPAGEVEQSVLLDDFSFINDLSEQKYEIEVNVAAIHGSNGEFVKPVSVKMLLNKASFSSNVALVGESGNNLSFTRIYANGEILNEDKMAFKFTVQLDKVLKEDAEFTLNVQGLEESLLSNIAFSSNSIVIPAGSLVSEEIVCEISDDFLKITDKDEEYSISISASATQENEYINGDAETNKIDVNIIKTSNVLEQVSKPDPMWASRERTGWKITTSPGVEGNPSSILDGSTYSGITAYGANNKLWFIAELPQLLEGVQGMHIHFDVSWYPPKKIAVSVSEDGGSWRSLGTLDVKVISGADLYIKFKSPTSFKFLKYEVLSSESSNKYVTEFNLYL